MLFTDDGAILASIKRNEGWPKFSNRASDLGGPTKGGITLDTLRTWRKNPKLTAADLQRLTEPEADALYRWLFLRPFDVLPEPLKPYLIDLGVLRGPQAATVMLQEIVGVDADGWIGPVTVGAIADFGIVNTLVMIIGARFAHIEQRVRDNPTQAEYRNGWRARNRSFLPKDTDTWRTRIPIPHPPRRVPRPRRQPEPDPAARRRPRRQGRAVPARQSSK